MANFVYLLPIIIFVWFPTTFIITYVIAVLRKDVNPIFPYISDTGTFSPESCIFGQLLNTGAIFMGIFAYVRYRQVKFLCDRHSLNEKIKSRNRISTWLGYSSAFGITIVGNFQETNVLWIHLCGAFLAFGLGSIWQCFQAWISLKLFPLVGKIIIINIRLALAVACVIFFVVTSVCGLLALLKFKGDDVTKWSRRDGGYDLHIISTTTEWIMSVAFASFIFSFTSEFRNVEFEEPHIKIWEVVEAVTASQTTLTAAVVDRF